MQYLAVIAGIFGIELGVKGYIEQHKIEGTTEKRCGGLFLIRKHHNRGAFLNAGQKSPGLIAALSVVLTLFLSVLFACSFTMAGKGALHWGLTLMLGGAYSNTYDRLKRKYVVDYVSFGIPFRKLGKVIFNISDFCIMIGALLSVFGYYQN